MEDLAQEAFEEAIIGRRDLRPALTEAAAQIDRELAVEEPRTLSGLTQVEGFLALAVGLTGVAMLLTCLRSAGPERRKRRQGYAFLSPSLLHLVVFGLGPVLFSLYLAFHRWSIVDPSKPFVGLAHFR